MTISLPPPLEDVLRARAERENRDPSEVAADIIQDALAADSAYDEQVIDGIRRSLESANVGRVRPVNQFMDEMRQKHGIPEDVLPMSHEEAAQLP